MTPTNAAAWLSEAKKYPFGMKESPVGKPEANEILIRNHAVAINPIDRMIQTKAFFPLKYPTILGQDVAGEVISIGDNVTRFKPGGRVLGHTVGLMAGRSEASGFQTYTIVQDNLACEIPDHITYEQAVVLPLCLSTAASGMFQEDFLHLNLPTEPRAASTRQTLIVWGGASSVGSNAIQLAVAAGYEVITTASPKNFDYVKRLGASLVFDYSSPTVGEDIVEVAKDKVLAGAIDCIGFSATAVCVDILSKSQGKKFVATVKGGFAPPPDGIQVKHIFGTTLKDNFVGKAVYEDFLPCALQSGAFVPAPEPLVVGTGLEKVQEAVDFMVYLGPSQGCETCKRRRKKCDKARPVSISFLYTPVSVNHEQSYLRCRKSKRTCAGYQEQASHTLIFQRNYTQTTTATHYWAAVKPLARKCSLPIRAPYPGTDILPDDACPKEVSEDDVVEYAVRGFFYDFFISSSDSISASVGFLKDLEQEVQRKGLDSNLAKACMMISCANHARKLYRPSFITRAEVLYHELLLHLAEEIARPGSVGERSDLIKLAWLMGLYEVVMADGTRLEQIDVHVRGISGMLQVENLSLSFVYGVFSRYSLGPGAQMQDPGVLRLQHSVNNLGCLHDILLEVSPLRMEAERVLADPTLTESHQHAILQRAAILNDRLARWEEILSPESKPTTIGHVRASSNPYIDVGHWPGPLHMYTDLRAAAILNVSRVAQCYLLDIICRLKLIRADAEDNDQKRLKAMQLIQEFTSSIAYHLVENLHSFSTTVQHGNPIEQPGRAVGGLLLMYPLYIASQLSTVPLELQDYFKRCLLWIGQNMGVGYASLLAKPESVLDDLNETLAPHWAGAKDVWNIFVLHTFQDGYDRYWDVESFRRFLASQHRGITSQETVYLLWRCLHFYAHYPFACSSRGSRIDVKGFQRAIALLVFRATESLGTRERGDHDEASFREADFRRLLRSISEPAQFYSAENQWAGDDIMDVLATTLPHSNLAPSHDELRDAAERIQPRGLIRRRLFRNEFSLFVRLLLQLRVWDVQGSRLPSGIFDDEPSSACQKLADSIADAVCNEDQTVDAGIVVDVLPGLCERFYRFWGAIFQPRSLRETMVPPEERLPNYILAAVSLLLPLGMDASGSTDCSLKLLPRTEDLGMGHLLQQVRGDRHSHILLFTDETCTAVIGAYIPNMSNDEAESQSRSSLLEDRGHFLFQLSATFSLLRSTGLVSSREELFYAESPSTTDQRQSPSYTIEHAEGGARLRVDPQSLTATTLANLKASSEEKAIFTDMCRDQDREWELTAHPPQLHIVCIHPSTSTPTWNRNGSKEGYQRTTKSYRVGTVE
ncbi:hypothetical protein CNMCM8980_010522 [Aspergillus fumigatiaffinis]|nr:hypothetical protein CNMCM8980_010522 [Aspergillus fumigatiaffinis]